MDGGCKGSGQGRSGLPEDLALGEIVDSLGTFIYVNDMETDEILFMNRAMKETFSLHHPEGKPCWQVLQEGMCRRCEFCPQHLLHEGAEPYFWEESNTRTGRIYENYDSLIRWTDGRLVHVQHSIDITERKRLVAEATVDELTGVLNRRAGRIAFESMKEKARREGVFFTLCMYDLNDLKRVNDSFGHSEGDKYLQICAGAVRRELTSKDVFFRMSGDEFIVLLYDCREEEASRRMRRAQRRAEDSAARAGKAAELPPGFSYGVFELAPEETRGFQAAFDEADAKMYAQKRRRHIRWAEKQAGQTPHADGAPVEKFVYDQSLLYDALVKSTDDYLYLCNMKTGTFRYPKSMVEEFDLPGEVLQNAAAVWSGRVHEHDRRAFLESNQEIADARTDSHSVEFRARNRRGEWVWLRCRGHLERDEAGEPALFAGIIENLGRRNRVDHLTGLPNKVVLEHQVDTLLESSSGKGFAFLLLDLDDFKNINDLYDRQFGDRVLRLLSRRIQSLLPFYASAYRMDGDEFAVLFRGGGKNAVMEFYASLKESFGRQQESEGKKFFCTLSAGCTFCPKDGTTYLDLVKYAHYSLEYAKASGKNCLMFFSEEILQSKKHALGMTEELRSCVENDMQGFSVYYQPQVTAETGRFCGAEALLRWSSEKYGSVPPSEFIPLLEESGLIHPVGRWVFLQAAAACAQWEAFRKGSPISVNVSYLQLERADFLDFLMETLQKTGASPEHMVLEFTESCIAYNLEALSETFRSIRKLGIKIAMDDFGTGYSSLGILKQSPADIVKIDRTFVRDIRSSSFDTTFIRFIVELCHDVGITVCLEGVETWEEYETVHPMALDSIQGFLFGRPMPQADFEALLRQNGI